MADTVKTPEQIAEDLNKAIDAKHDDVMKTADAALTEAKKSGVLSAETKASADAALTGINTLREQLADIEQKMARKPTGEDQVKSYGEQLVESDRFKAWTADGKSGSLRMRFKAITAAQAGAVSGRDLAQPVAMPQRELTIRDLLTVVPTDSGSVDYARQTTRTNAAAAVAEGAAKPTSAYVWAIINAPVRTIAHLAKLTRQAIDDQRQLQGEVEQEMRYGLKLTEEDQILNGDGVGENLSGLVTNATAYVAPFDPAGTETPIDFIRLAMLQADLALYPVDGIVMNPTDWARIELTKDTTGGYIFTNPANLAGPRLWSKPVVSTPAMTVDKFLVGGFKLQTLYDRMDPEVLISSENSDDFEKNLYTMRCEERLALAVKRPGALIYGDFGFVV